MPLYLFYTIVQKSQKWPKTQIKGGSCLNDHVYLCLSTGFVPVMIKLSGVMAWRFGRLTGMPMQSLSVAQFGSRLPGMLMQSHGTVLSWHGDLLVPRPTFLISMLTCCQKARYDSLKPLSAPGQTWVESVLYGSFERTSGAPREAACWMITQINFFGDWSDVKQVVRS